MALIEFVCSCGNTDPKKAIEYDGLMGYEAVICTSCSAFADEEGEHRADDWSISLVKDKEANK